MKKKFLDWIVVFIFAILGLGFSLPGVIGFANLPAEDEIAETEAQITHIVSHYDKSADRTSHDVYVTYEVDGKTYENVPISYWTGSMYEGKVITISYNPKNPSEVHTEGAAVFFATFSGIGGVFLLIAIVLVYKKLGKNRRVARLMAEDRYVEAEFDNVVINGSVTVNRRNPYNVVCRWKSPGGKIYLFKSDNVWNHPMSIIDERGIEKFRVWVDIDNPKIYRVDLGPITDNVVDLT